MRARTVRSIKKTLKIDASAKLPKRLYVRRIDPEGGGLAYFTTDATPYGAQDGDIVGLYELITTKQMKITRTLE